MFSASHAHEGYYEALSLLLNELRLVVLSLTLSINLN
jgi:hypothetical protein